MKDACDLFILEVRWNVMIKRRLPFRPKQCPKVTFMRKATVTFMDRSEGHVGHSAVSDSDSQR